MSKTKTTRSAAKKVTANKTPNRSETSVKNAIKIINTALSTKSSLSEASRQHNFGRNYVSDIKTRITGNYKKKAVTKETYNTFNTLVKKYNTVA